MTRLSIVFVITALFFSCGQGKQKMVYDEAVDTALTIDRIKDTTKILISELPVKFESTNSPSRPFHLTVHEGSNWNLKIDSVTEKQFDKRKAEIYEEKKMNRDSLLKAFSEMYRETIILNDSCCILKGWDKDLKVCRRRPDNDKEWTGYEAVDYDHGFLVVMEWAYETGAYINFNPTTRKYVYTSNEPRFIDDDFIYAVGNYYGEGQFQIKDMKREKYFGFESFAWEITGFYRQENSILMEFSSYANKKYLRVKF